MKTLRTITQSLVITLLLMSTQLIQAQVTADQTFDVWKNGVKGMKIYPKFRVDNAQNRTLKVVAYFYFTSGTALNDYNGFYQTTDGKVSASAEVYSYYQSSIFNMGSTYDFSIFMPYDELHLSNDVRHQLKYFLVVYDGNREISRSDWQFFHYFNGNKDKLVFKNDTYKTIYVAIRFKNLSNEWETKYWYTLKPGERAYLEDTRNRNYYFYAYDASSQLVWEGTDHYETINGKVYGFRSCYISNNDWGDQILNLTGSRTNS